LCAAVLHVSTGTGSAETVGEEARLETRCTVESPLQPIESTGAAWTAASGDKSPRGLKPAPHGPAPVFITIGGPQAHVDRPGGQPHDRKTSNYLQNS